MALNDADPWNTQTNDPNAGVQSTQVAPQVAKGQTTGSQVNGQLVTGYTSGAANSTSWQPASYAPQQQQGGAQPAGGYQYAPMDVGYNGNVPGMGENVSAALIGHYAENGLPGTTQNAQGSYNAFNASTPADMSRYYDNASRNAANAINTQMAARGSYGSSNAVGVLSNAEMNLRAQQAKDEAGYGLQRAGLAGQLASGADQSSQAHSSDERNWVGALADLGFANQKEGAARYQMGNQDILNGANIGSNIENGVGSNEIQAQEDLLMKQLMAQGMSASDAATAAHNTVSAQNASDQRAVDTTEKAVQMGAMFV